MLMPSIFGENLFDDWMDFSFPNIEKALYGTHTQNAVMKTDVKGTLFWQHEPKFLCW